MKPINNTRRKVLQIVNFVFILIALGLRIYNLFSFTTVLRLIADISGCITLVFAIIYCLYGFKKDAAKYFKIYVWLYTIMSFIHIAIEPDDGTSRIVLLLNALTFATALVITLSADLGKTKTLLLGAINFAAIAVSVCIFLIAICDGSLEMIIVCVGQIVPAIEFNLMLLGKYTDKVSRGAK